MANIFTSQPPAQPGAPPPYNKYKYNGPSDPADGVYGPSKIGAGPPGAPPPMPATPPPGAPPPMPATMPIDDPYYKPDQKLTGAGYNDQPPAFPGTQPAAAPAAEPPPPLAGPGSYEQWYDANKDAFSNPGAAEDFYRNNSSAWNDPSGIETMGPSTKTAYEEWATGQGLSALNTPGRSEGVLDEFGNQLKGPSRAESLGDIPDGQYDANAIASGLSGVNGAASAYDEFFGDMTATSRAEGLQDVGPGAYQEFYRGNKGAFADSSRTENFADAIDPNKKSYSESLYESGEDFLNPFYDRASQRAIEAAQRASSARGGFNSGLAAQQESDILSDLRGQQAKEMIGLAGQADVSKGNRDRFNLDAFSGADETYRNRVLDTGELAKTSEELGLDTAAENRERASASDASKRGRAETGLKLGTAKDDSILDRTRVESDIFEKGDRLDLDRAGEETNRAAAADRSFTERVDTYRQSAKDGDESQRNRLLDQNNMLKDSSDMDLTRQQMDRNTAIAQGDAKNDRTRLGLDAAGDANDAYNNRIEASGAIADRDQQTGEKRLGDSLDRQLELDRIMAGIIQSGYTNGGAASADGLKEEINALVQSGAVDQQTANNLIAMLGPALSTGLKLKGLKK